MSLTFVMKLITHLILFAAVVFASAYLDQLYRARRDRRRRIKMYRELQYQLALMDRTLMDAGEEKKEQTS